MRYLLFIFAIFFSASLQAQERDIASLTSEIDSTHIPLTVNWRFQKGDNPDWKELDFDDSGWKSFTNANLAMLDSIDKLEEKEVYWFRKYFTIDTSYESVLFELFIGGATELYINGKEIIRVGETGSEPEGEAPFSSFGFAKLDSGQLYVLAIKYQYVKSNRFLPEKHQPQLLLRMTSAAYADSLGFKQKVVHPTFDRALPSNYILIGLSIFLTLLFLGLWLYTREKTYLYLFLISLLMSIEDLGQIDAFTNGFRPEENTISGLTLSLLLFFIHLFSYEVLERPKDKWHKVVSYLVIIPIVVSFFGKVPFGLPLYVIVVLISVYRICYLQRKTKKSEAITLVILSLIVFFPFILAGLEIIFGFKSGLDPNFLYLFIFFIPIGLGGLVIGTFGKRTKELQRNLSEVERLSQEREEILASQNEKLEKEVNQRTKDLKESLENLKSTQAQLIQSEKMASLGELTAGIAHEIQNPLNFVNNFSDLNKELIEEANEEMDKGDLEEVKAILNDLGENSEKINHHGKRAGDIVRGMLEHSRKSDGQREETDINALADEYLRLSYHGLRAKDKSFQSDFETNLDSNIPKINVNPSDISRVFLNLINNAFYEVDKKKKATPDSDFKPLVTLKSRLIEMDGKATGAEFAVVDNADGIPADIKNKIFQPFFTTKPTGSGTGLGLSLSYDIVKAHGGDLRVKSTEGEGTEMIIYLPI